MTTNADPQRILIVEDEPHVAEALSNVLQMPQNGAYQVAYCDSAEAALLKLSESYLDLLITDLNMPGMNGLELLEHARRISPTTRSILITAYGSANVEARVRHLANGYLPKPFSLQNFLQMVRQALDSPAVTLQPVIAFSEEGLRAIQERLERLRADTGALSVALPDWSGQLLVECGQPGEPHLDALLALLGNSMAAAAEVARLLEEEDGFELHYHPGKHLAVYSAIVNNSAFLALVLDRRVENTRIGLVSLYMQRTITDLRKLWSTALMESSGALNLGTGLANAMNSALDEAFNFDDQARPAAVQAIDAPPPDAESPDSDPLNSSLRYQDSLLTFEQARTLGVFSAGNVP